MKRFYVLLILMLAAGSALLSAQDVNAILAGADAAFELNRVYSKSTLTVTRDGREQPPQVMESYELDAPDGTSRSLSVFSAPPRVAGTAYLMLGDDLWVRFASTGRVRKLSSSAKSNSAAGSDFSYADMGDGSQSFTEDYSAALDGQEDIRGIKAYRIILTPKDDGAEYEKLIAWVSVDNPVYLQIEFYKDGAPIKTMDLEDYRAVGTARYPFTVRMRSLTSDSVSEIVTDSMEADSPKVQENFFSSAYLRTLR